MECDSDRGLGFWQIGLGPVGRMLVERAARRGWRLVGASDPAYAGRELDALMETELGDVRVEERGVDADVDVVFVATVSEPREVASQIEGVLGQTDAVVTTCEELAHPPRADEKMAQSLAESARDAEARVLAAGVNPGYAMDLFPVFATGASSHVERVEVVRRADVSERRAPLQRKVGAGMAPEAFERAVDEGELGHRGTEASLRLIASALGRSLHAIETDVRGVPAERMIRTEHLEVEPGEMRGVEHEAAGYVSGRDEPFVEYRLRLAVGVREPVDRVRVRGEPGLEFEVPEGLPGDVCTANVALNYTGVLLDAPPGLYDVTELPVPRPAF